MDVLVEAILPLEVHLVLLVSWQSSHERLVAQGIEMYLDSWICEYFLHSFFLLIPTLPYSL